MGSAFITKDGLPIWTLEQLQAAMVEALYKQGMLTDEQQRSIRESLRCDRMDHTKENGCCGKHNVKGGLYAKND